MKRYERICSLLLAMLLLLGVFVACKSKPQKEQPFDTEPNTEIEWRPRAKYNGNNYYTYQPYSDGETEAEFFSVPGRGVVIWAVWSMEKLPVHRQSGRSVNGPRQCSRNFAGNRWRTAISVGNGRVSSLS